MKTAYIYLVATLVAFAFTAQLKSQAPEAPKTPLQQLQALKLQNQQVLEKQTATLLKLDELQKEAAQIKFLAARS